MVVPAEYCIKGILMLNSCGVLVTRLSYLI